MDILNDGNRSFKYDDNRPWINRMALHLGEVVQYCFGDEQNLEAYDQLAEFSAFWMHSRATSALPMFFDQPLEGGVFPEIHLLTISATVEMQYYHLIRILLTAHNPSIPRLGKARLDAAKVMDVSTAQNVVTTKADGLVEPAEE